MTIRELSDWIILFGGIAVAIINLYNFFAKPTSYFKKKRQEAEKEHFCSMLEEEMPALFLQHDSEIRKKYLNDRERSLEEIREAVLEETKDTLAEIKKINLEQNSKIEILTQTSKDVLRQRIMNIYHNYKGEKSFPIHAKEALEELYKDYKAEHGNSYIDKYYNRMKSWEIYDDDKNEYL